MSGVWEEPRESGWIWGAAGSFVLHGAIAAALFLAPAEARDHILGKVDFTVQKKVRETKPPEKKPEQKTQKPDEEEIVKVAKRKPAARKPMEDPPPEAPPPAPPPKFQMSGETFAGDGTWALAAEVGESRFGSLSGEGEYDKKAEKKVDKPAKTGTGGSKKSAKGFSPAKPGEVKEKPKVVLEQQIPYPAEARKLGIEGKVRLRVDINKKGRVVGVQVLKDPGGGLGKAAAKAIKGFLFSPAIGLNGKPVDYRITYTYVFKLE
jgi:protein TonB